MTIRIIVAGPRGNMGSEALKMIESEPSFELVACIDRINNSKNVQDIETLPNIDAPIYTNAKECLTHIEADVLLDLTIPETGYIHTKLALEHDVRPVVGTSGFTKDQVETLATISEQKEIGGIIAPNFATGAVLMMKFSKLAAKFFQDVEIIEKHHDQKLDAPSGTAIKTGELIQGVRKSKQQGHPDEFETLKGARGATMDGIHIHSLRLPGLVAHQEVIFGGEGQTLSIKHDSLNRQSFMPGIKIAIDQVMSINHLIYGLENIPYFND